MARTLGKLTALAVSQVKRRGYYGDGGGLFLQASNEPLVERSHGRRKRTPLPPPELVAPSLINSTPAASRAAITLVRLSMTPRTVPLLASMRWIVGSDTPEAADRAFWSMPTSTRAAFICAAVSNTPLQQRC